MASPIDKKTIAHLADLARIALSEKEEVRLQHDLANIIDYFEELKQLDTRGIAPMTGGSDRMNMFREDAPREDGLRGTGRDAFPESQDGYLKVPPVFD